MRGLFKKELLYTRRNARAIALHIAAPLVVIAVNTFLLQRQEWRDARVSEFAVYIGFYVSVSFTTVFRAVERIRVELVDGTAHLYALTRASYTRLIFVKFGFEAVINAAVVSLFISWLALTRGGFIGWGDVIHVLTASLALTALTCALSCLIRSDESYRTVTLFLSLTPLLPGFLAFGGVGRYVTAFVPTLTAFEGFQSIASNAPIDLTLPGLLICAFAVSIAICIHAYPRMFAFWLTRPAA